MRFSPPLQVLERGPGGEVSESPVTIYSKSDRVDITAEEIRRIGALSKITLTSLQYDNL